MQLLFLFLIFLFITFTTSAQEETIFSNANKTGGFGAPVLKVTTIKDQTAILFGGRGGWVINHSFIIGGGGYGIVSEVDADAGVLPEEGPLDIELGYGGLELEYLVNPQSLTHYSAYILLGVGSNNYVKDKGSVFDSNEQTGESDFVFVIEPAINAELNVTTWFRLDAGMSYRYVHDVNQPGLKNSDLSGISGQVTFKFGKF